MITVVNKHKLPPKRRIRKDVLRNADQVWVQTQYISHAAFYRTVSAMGSDTQLRFFVSKSARICAEQLVTG